MDRAEKIVVHKIDLPITKKRHEFFYSKIVRDFRSGMVLYMGMRYLSDSEVNYKLSFFYLYYLGLEFRISSNTKKSADCIVEPISSEFELTSHNLKRFMLEHAKLLLNFDPSFVNYWGQVLLKPLPNQFIFQHLKWIHVKYFNFLNAASD